MPQQRLWTRDELIPVLNLYMKLPFGKMYAGNPDVIYLANLIGRTPGSVAMRLVNYASVDPYHQNRGVTGLSGGRKQVEPIWNEFVDNREELLFESERILAQLEHTTIEEKYRPLLRDISDLRGAVRVREVKTRVNQHVFRQVVVANYDGKCAITGIDIPELIVASHIIPWSANDKERLNPENGLCLNRLHDKAFDEGYITIDKDYRLMLSPELKKKEKEPYYSRFFTPIEKQKLTLPKKYLPKQEFLEFHRDTIFMR